MALTACVLKHPNSSSKSFVAISLALAPVAAQLFNRDDTLVRGELCPERAVGVPLLLEGVALSNPDFHRNTNYITGLRRRMQSIQKPRTFTVGLMATLRPSWSVVGENIPPTPPLPRLEWTQ